MWSCGYHTPELIQSFVLLTDNSRQICILNHKSKPTSADLHIFSHRYPLQPTWQYRHIVLYCNITAVHKRSASPTATTNFGIQFVSKEKRGKYVLG
ncbi:hypothetical protein K443DRAFT_368790 [Laccaria amethystina LaAM-08-1]|uniref:Unplaced genomic scaffold K443scaffold_271, whole genome shotgun sequence n=1 Tax=Laccaria amethystina LaAM-08-1 TaxID=1095629 RepID=A0A0C9X938_9AGAR|nr:hypothetical protein K443DRAFT_368790 [Laccaria amethystina LaAM-08-1]